MSNNASSATRRLSQIGSQIINAIMPASKPTSIPWDPDCTSFPTLSELPTIPNAPEGAPAAWVWGTDDFVGRLNLLTSTRIKSALSEIRTGEKISLNLPLDVPANPGFGRQPFKHEIKAIMDGAVFDDFYNLNTQSGSQWDGFRHFAWTKTGTWYNNTKSEDVIGPNANSKCSLHHWSVAGGIAGRGILLDYRTYAGKHGKDYDPMTSHAISWDELNACGREQGIDIRPASQGGDIKIGDILFIRSGFVERYWQMSADERGMMATEHDTGTAKDGAAWAGVLQDDQMKEWLHDCYFAAVAGDSVSFECWPSKKGKNWL